MLRSDFDYALPPELIAQDPLGERDRSRMLILDRGQGTWRDGSFAELPGEVGPGDAIVLNNTRVFPARLNGYRLVNGGRGGRVEALLLRPLGDERWEVLARPARALRRGAALSFGDGRLRARVEEEGDEGRRILHFECDGEFDALVDEIGATPLPPYIRREAAAERRDAARYQTVYARSRGAVAAPTAGLHFTPRVLTELEARGARLVEITHHVGYATFQPVRVEQIEDHRIASEQYEITPEAAASINAAREAGRRVIAIGTTTVRALESAADEEGRVRAERGMTDLFIHPGYRFRVVDALLTNFHLPQSSLLMLVATLAGYDLTMRAYRHAVERRYRFYSYGDCMLVS
jgi:S-adenosylmethionine:tRNA ribosyltransferase-isomerase